MRRHIVVNGTPERAFEVFTQRFDAVKPREHNLLGVPIVETVLEPRVGGRIVDRGDLSDQPLPAQMAERGAYMIPATPTRQMSAPTTS
ncbi:hypothetical protein NSZ01_04450 [Nocardioides szechwanensis]|nr:hypothetical protein NSZ01_04450 [Nocardioides szechwanensis]